MLRPAPPPDPAITLRERAAEALKLLEVTIDVSPYASTSSRRNANRAAHALRTARHELQRLVELLAPR
jgi:hypothetical protein